MRFTGILALAGAVAAFAAAAPADMLRGTASYRERIAMPPGTVFTAVLEDISRADAPAVELGRAVIEDAGNPPYDFAIDYDPAAVDPRHTYAVRATLRRPDGALAFTSDTVTPVLTGGAGDRADLLLVQATPGAPADDGVRGAHGLRLPATFTGTLPCADCPGIAHHLDLWPDQSFHLRREWLDRPTPNRHDAMGRWHADPARRAIVLHGSGGTHLEFEVTNDGALRLLDQAGGPIESDLPYELTTEGTLDPTPLSLPMEGEFVYFADAARFEVCLTGRSFPVEMAGDYLAAERAYLEARAAPQDPVMMVVEGSIDTRPAMEGPDRPSLRIERLIATQPGRRCAQSRAEAPLVNTYWKLTRLDGAPVAPVPGATEPHLVLLGGDDPRLAATVGCNRMIGGYERSGDRLRPGPVASTMMACPPPLDTLERDFAAMLEAVRRAQVVGQTLLLRDAEDRVRAVFAAVYLP